MTLLTQRQFETLDAYCNLAAGSYELEYHDNTHMTDGQWSPLLEVTINTRSSGTSTGSAEFYYTLQRSGHVGAVPPEHTRVVDDTISLSLTRLGLLSPLVAPKFYRDIVELSDEEGIVVVPDTNALYNGCLHWLLRVLQRSKIWVLPLVVSLTQIQQRDVHLKALVGKRLAKNLSQALRSRALVNASLGLLERYRTQYQVVELDPSLLRYVKPSGRGTADADDSDILEDRLLIEVRRRLPRTKRCWPRRARCSRRWSRGWARSTGGWRRAASSIC
jgi:hypothetical protein